MQAFWTMIIENIKMLRLRDILDIAIVAFFIYKGVKLVKETRAVQLIKGIVILVVVTQLSGWLQFNSLSYILRNAMQVGLIALLIVFQPELRRALEKVGRSSVGWFFSPDGLDVSHTIGELVEAAVHLSEHKIGALMVVERTTKLADITKTGVEINSDVSAQLLVNIFIPNTPLHDGAVIIGDDRIKAAACFLPLTQNNNLSKELGTRHRAAIGISENADCVVVVVSEETGKISIAINGDMTRNLNGDTLKRALEKTLCETHATETARVHAKAKAKIKGWAVKKK
ncbi:MAG: TIGR00159 family protein [Ruminococcaceae bacterium]|nr:TIGR00159 family protein [Oscillospiraceae bacterium]